MTGWADWYKGRCKMGTLDHSRRGKKEWEWFQSHFIFIPLFNKYLLHAYYMLSSEEIAVNRAMFLTQQSVNFNRGGNQMHIILGSYKCYIAMYWLRIWQDCYFRYNNIVVTETMVKTMEKTSEFNPKAVVHNCGLSCG